MTQGIHRQQRGVACLVTEVIAELAAGKFRATVWLGSDELSVANAHEGVHALDVNKASAHGGQGYGWNRIYLDDIAVPDGITNGKLTYGVTLDCDIVQKYGQGSDWFSACDFIVERIGD